MGRNEEEYKKYIRERKLCCANDANIECTKEIEFWWNELAKKEKKMDAAVSEQEDELDAIQMEIAATKESVQQGIALAIDRGDKLEDLDDKAINLSDEATVFNKKSK